MRGVASGSVSTHRGLATPGEVQRLGTNSPQFLAAGDKLVTSDGRFLALSGGFEIELKDRTRRKGAEVLATVIAFWQRHFDGNAMQSGTSPP